MTNQLLSTHHGSRIFVSQTLAITLTVLCAIAIAILTLAPVNVPNALPRDDKTYHLVAFATLVLPSSVLYPRALFWVLPCSFFLAAASRSCNQQWVAVVNGQIFTLMWWGLG